MTEEVSTMRRPRPRAETEAAPAAMLGSSPVLPEADPPPVAEEDTGTLSPVLGGWSQGQREQDATSSYAQALKPDSQMQYIKFLDNAPYANFRRHWVERTGENGTYKRPYVCLQTVGKNCPLCGIGEKPQAVSAFNVALIGDEGQIDLKSWDVGGKLFATLKGYNDDPRMGPLTKGYFAVNKTKTGRGGGTSVNASPVSRSAAADDYGLQVPTDEQLAALPRYDADIIDLPRASDLQEIADEMANDD